MPPGSVELLTLLTGATGCLILSLLLNWLQYHGRLINPRCVVPREDYDASLSIGERATAAVEKLSARRGRGAS